MRGFAIYVTAMLAAGVAALQAPVNSRLADAIGFWATNVSSNVIGTVVLIVAMAIVQPQALNWRYWADCFQQTNPVLWTGGLLGCVYMVASVLAVKKIGASAWITIAFAGQVVSGLLVDSFGLLGVPVAHLDWRHFAGLALILGGTALFNYR